MHPTPEQPENPGVPQWFYPALGLPQTPETGQPEPSQGPAPPLGHAPPEGGKPPSPTRRWEKALAGCLVVAFIFLLGWWWGARRSGQGEQSPLALVGAVPVDNSLAGLDDDDLFALLPTENDYPNGWKVTRARGESIPGSSRVGARIDPPECDLRKATKPSDTIGSVKGEAPRLLLVQAASAEVRLARDPQGQGPFVAAEDFAKRCPRVTINSGGEKAVMRLRTQRDTVPEATESMTITMTGSVDSGQAIQIPVILTMTGARARGLVVIGSGMRAGLSLSLPGGDGGMSEDPDVAQQLLRGTVQRIKQK